MNTHLNKLCLMFVSILLWLTVLGTGSIASAQGDGWEQPVQISDDEWSQTSWFPDLAVTPDGSVHIVWCSFPKLHHSNGDISSLDTLMYRVLKNNTWSKINDIASRINNNLEEYTVRSSIVAGRDGKLHVLFRNGIEIKSFSAQWNDAWSAHSWSTARLISGNTSYYDALAIDSAGILHAVWSESVPDDPQNKDCPSCANLFYRRSLDGGELWSKRINLSHSFDGATKPQIVVDGQDRIHLTWDEGYDNMTGKGLPKAGVYRRSDDGGLTWSAPARFEVPGQGVLQTTLAVTSAGNPFVVYRTSKSDSLFFQFSSDGGTTWNKPAEIPGVRARAINDTPWDHYNMTVDGADHIHLLMVGSAGVPTSTEIEPSLLHTSWDGRTWSQPDVVSSGNGIPEWPRIVASAGNKLHAVWFTRPKANEKASLRVWYSSKLIDAPATVWLPLFTPTPHLAPTSTPTAIAPAPTATIPAGIMGAPAIKSRPEWEISGLLTLGIALGPVVGLLGIIWAILQFNKRRNY